MALSEQEKNFIFNLFEGKSIPVAYIDAGYSDPGTPMLRHHKAFNLLTSRPELVDKIRERLDNAQMAYECAKIGALGRYQPKFKELVQETFVNFEDIVQKPLNDLTPDEWARAFEAVINATRQGG